MAMKNAKPTAKIITARTRKGKYKNGGRGIGPPWVLDAGQTAGFGFRFAVLLGIFLCPFWEGSRYLCITQSASSLFGSFCRCLPRISGRLALASRPTVGPG